MSHQCGTLRYFWHLGPFQVGPPIRSVPDLRHDLGFRRRLLAAILAGRREDEFRVMRDLLRELRLGLLRYSTLGSCNPGSRCARPPPRPPSSQFCRLQLARTGMADTAFSSGLYEEKNPIDRKRC